MCRSKRAQLSALLFVTAFMLSAVAFASPPRGAGAMFWSDEFDGTSLDLTKWAYYPWSTRNDARVSSSAVSVSGGSLNMKVYTEAGQHYTGFITSAKRDNSGAFTDLLFTSTYGYFETRIKFHSAPGMWSAFWITSPTIGNPIGNAPVAGTEIDVVEHRATNKSGSTITPVTDKYNLGLHWDGYGADHKSSTFLTGSLAGLGDDSWHTYGLFWWPAGYTFYYDNVPVWTAPTSVPISARSEYLLFSSEVSNNSWAGLIPAEGYGSAATSLNGMQVDYVRAYYVPEPHAALLLPMIALAGTLRRSRYGAARAKSPN